MGENSWKAYISWAILVEFCVGEINKKKSHRWATNTHITTLWHIQDGKTEVDNSTSGTSQQLALTMDKVKEINMGLSTQQGHWWLMPTAELESNKWWGTVTHPSVQQYLHLTTAIQKLHKSGAPTQRSHTLSRSQMCSLMECSVCPTLWCWF